MLDYHGRAPANHHTAIEFTFEAPIVKNSYSAVRGIFYGFCFSYFGNSAWVAKLNRRFMIIHDWESL